MHDARGARIGLDTEFLREKTYRPKLCLVQVATDRGVYVLDPLAGLDITPLAELVGAADVEVCVHAGRQDLELFFDRFGVVPTNVFDVQVAAGFAGYGSNLPYGRLVQSVLDVGLQKGESYSDWCRRPLTASQLRYAADDVRFLLAATDRLKRRLADAGRLEWVREEMRGLEEVSTYEVDPDGAWRRISGRGTLSAKQMGVLQELARWRELEAERRDLPRGWVIRDQSLIEIARRAPTTLQQLRAIRGMNAGMVDRAGNEILAAVQRGRATTPVSAPPTPPRALVGRIRAVSGIADALLRARADEAGIAPDLVATRDEVEALLAAVLGGNATHDNRLLQGWRRALAGDRIVALAEGRIAVRAIERPPYVQEIPWPIEGGS